MAGKWPQMGRRGREAAGREAASPSRNRNVNKRPVSGSGKGGLKGRVWVDAAVAKTPKLTLERMSGSAGKRRKRSLRHPTSDPESSRPGYASSAVQFSKAYSARESAVA